MKVMLVAVMTVTVEGQKVISKSTVIILILNIRRLRHEEVEELSRSPGDIQRCPRGYFARQIRPLTLEPALSPPHQLKFFTAMMGFRYGGSRCTLCTAFYRLGHLQRPQNP